MSSSRWYLLRVFTVVAKSMVLWPLASLVCWTVNGRPVAVPQLVLLYLLSIPLGAWGIRLRALLREERTSRTAGMILTGAMAAVLLALDGLLLWQRCANPCLAVCAAAALAVCFVWGWRVESQPNSDILHPNFLFIYGGLTLVCLIGGTILEAIYSVELVEPIPLVLNAALCALLSFLVLNQAYIGETADRFARREKTQARKMRIYNRRLLCLIFAVTAALTLLCWNGILWVAGKTGDVLSGGVKAVLSSWISRPPPEVDRVVTEEVRFDFEPDTAVPQLPVQWILAVLALLLLVLFRRPLLRMLRQLFAGRVKTERQRKSQYYTEQVEDASQEDLRVFRRRNVPRGDPLAAQLVAFRVLRDPTARVRRALALLREIYTQRSVPFQAGDTPRELVARMDADAAALSRFAGLYEKVRYGGYTPSAEQADAAAALVFTVAQKVRQGGRALLARSRRPNCIGRRLSC